jgi:hypothetical protein
MPYAGLNLRCNIAGNIKQFKGAVISNGFSVSGGSHTTTYRLLDSSDDKSAMGDKALKRFQLGINAGVGFTFGKFYVGAGYTADVTKIANNADVVIIDTAGRLHNKIGLMNELTKIKNVMQKVVADAPHEVLLVLDGSTGQNAFEQAKQFTKATEVTAMAITKLDGTAKGGVVIGISEQFKIPVKYIGLGEGIEDLQVFRRKEFVDSLFGETEK